MANSEEFREFRLSLDSFKRTLPGIPWYPYDTFESFRLFSAFRKHPSCGDLLRNGPVLDLGCGDGDIAFFLEHLGYDVTAVDNPATNNNRMEGVRSLAQQLGSRIAIQDADIDECLFAPLDPRRYQFTFLLGVLYHLANPFGVLRSLARRSRYCLMSTRVADRTPDRRLDISEHCLAYLAGDREINNDATNYWIFSRPALFRLLERSGWEVLDWFRHGCRNHSDPVTTKGDERIFCLLASRMVDPWYRVMPNRGIHPSEQGWCWTTGQFSFLVESALPQRLLPAAGVRMELEFRIAEARWEESGARLLHVSANGVPVGSMTVAQPGRHLFQAIVPCDVVAAQTPLILEFRIDQALSPTAADPRELGVILGEVESDFGLRISGF